MSIANSFVNYIRDSRKELNKVNWPSRQQTLQYSFIVVMMSLTVAAFLGGIDYILGLLLKNYVIK